MEIQPVDPSGADAAHASALLTVLASDGSADPANDPRLSRERVVHLFESMLTARLVGERFGALATDGTIGFFPSARGMEAAIAGATCALREHDWIFPTYDDWGAALARGASIATLAHRAFGGSSDPLSGRDVPAAFASRALRIASTGAAPANRLPHAVGFAWAARQRGEDLVAAAFLDGAEVDAADFHTGLNFAGVMRAPVVFVCRVRAGEEGAAGHAIAYGLASVRCDGSDVLAVVRAVSEARERAAQGHPSVIDLVIGEQDEALARARAHLVRMGAWDEAREQALAKRVEDELAAGIADASRAGAPPLRSIFDDVFATTTPELEQQYGALARSPRPRG